MDPYTQSIVAREALEPKMRGVSIDGWDFDVCYGSGAWSWEKGPAIVWASPWWEGEPGICLCVEVMTEDASPSFEFRYSPDSIDTNVVVPGSAERAVDFAAWYLAAMTKFLQQIEMYIGD